LYINRLKITNSPLKKSLASRFGLFPRSRTFLYLARRARLLRWCSRGCPNLAFALFFSSVFFLTSSFSVHVRPQVKVYILFHLYHFEFPAFYKLAMNYLLCVFLLYTPFSPPFPVHYNYAVAHVPAARSDWFMYAHIIRIFSTSLVCAVWTLL